MNRAAHPAAALGAALLAGCALPAAPRDGAGPEARELASDTRTAKRGSGMIEFMRARRARRYARVPRKVLAFYYTWYGTPERHGRWVHWDKVDAEKHEIASSTNYPALGAYDSHDPEVIDGHIDLAKGCGIDGFICTWWGQGRFDDRALVTVLERAEAKGFEISIYWETVPGEGKVKLDRAVDDLVYVLEKYGAHPAFLRHEGKPVVFVYGRIMGQIDALEWPEIIRRASERYGRDFILLADGYRTDYARVFDGIHTYNICGWVQKKTPAELRAASRESFRSAVAMAKERARISCITVIPGYDDTKIRTPGIDAKRLGGETYRVLWEEAVAADPDWVLITSWNEWHEGSEIEPSIEHGDRYLELTAEHARRFKETAVSAAPVPEAPPGPSAGKARELRELFAGRTVGILPGFGGEAVLWLAGTGLAVKELAWEGLLDPETFTPAKLPVVVYAGYESYVQTVREAGDVDRALVRYLKGGGLLMALGTGPFPFFYNEHREPVVSAGRFGFPVRGSGGAGDTARGWETPPEGAKLAFEIDAEFLPGFPPAVPFPASGDLRWRPSVREGLSEGDVYLALAKLKDETGREYGDGIACVERRASEPKGGVNIYAWMRMADVLDADELLFALFKLAAEKSGGRP